MCQRLMAVGELGDGPPAAAERASRRWITSNQPAAFVVNENQSPRTRSRTVPATADETRGSTTARWPSRRWPAWCRRTCTTHDPSRPPRFQWGHQPGQHHPGAGHGGACPGSASFPRPDAASGPRPPRQPRPGSGPPRRAPSLHDLRRAGRLPRPRAAIGASSPVPHPGPQGCLAGSTSPATKPIRRSVTTIRNADKLDLASRDRRLDSPTTMCRQHRVGKTNRSHRPWLSRSPPTLWEPWVVTCAHPAPDAPVGSSPSQGRHVPPNVSHNDPVPAPRAPRRSNNLCRDAVAGARRAPIQPSPPNRRHTLTAPWRGDRVRWIVPPC